MNTLSNGWTDKLWIWEKMWLGVKILNLTRYKFWTLPIYIHTLYICGIMVLLLIMVINLLYTSWCLKFWNYVVPNLPLFFQVQGVEGIMAAYGSALHNFSLSGPTLFGQVISKAAEIAGQSLSYNRNKYFVLLIITVLLLLCFCLGLSWVTLLPRQWCLSLFHNAQSLNALSVLAEGKSALVIAFPFFYYGLNTSPFL